MTGAVSNQAVLANPMVIGLLAYGCWLLARRWLIARDRWYDDPPTDHDWPDPPQHVHMIRRPYDQDVD